MTKNSTTAYAARRRGSAEAAERRAANKKAPVSAGASFISVLADLQMRTLDAVCIYGIKAHLRKQEVPAARGLCYAVCMTYELELSDSYSYDQKEVLRGIVLGFIREHGARSLLDIGAGYAETAVSYSEAVERYVAIERNPESADRLAARGLTVVVGAFPVPVDGSFDLVLSSHSIPEGDAAPYGQFLSAAWKLVNPGGHLLVITFKGAYDAGRKIKCELAGECSPHDAALYDEMMRVLRGFGEPEETHVPSFHRSTKLGDLVEIASFSLGLGEECRESVARIIERDYKTAEGYAVPTEHVVVSLRKPPQ